MRRSVVLAVGHYVPERVVTNNDLAKLMDTSDEWIQSRSGIQQRRYITQGMGNTEMSLEASQMAVERAQKSYPAFHQSKIDLIILATLSPDHHFPGDACFLQDRLGLPGVAALDIRQQCSGFIYGISIADQFIKTGMYKTVLVVGTEVHSTGLDFSTRGRDVTVLFGDGAGAVLLGASDFYSEQSNRGILSTHLHADGRFAKELWTEFPSSRHFPGRMTAESLTEGRIYPKMNGRSVFTAAVRKFPEVIKEALDANKMSLEEIDLFVFHQANLRIVQAVTEALGVSMDKTFNNIQRYGNTTAASIPIALSEAYQEGKLFKDAKVCLASFGAGFTWASAILRW